MTPPAETTALRPPRIKICCIASLTEARLAIELGASALGLVSEMPSGPGVIDEAEIAAIAARIPPPIATFLLTSRTEAEAIVEQQRRCGVDTLQLVDRVEPRDHEVLRRALPGVRLVQVIHVTGEDSVSEAVEAARTVDALLLDSGNPTAKVRELGGTGRTHDWELSTRIVREAAVPVFLAGGLRASNVAEAIGAVRPFGVDLCTGVRTDGNLDPAKLAEFVRAVSSAAAED